MFYRMRLLFLQWWYRRTKNRKDTVKPTVVSGGLKNFDGLESMISGESVPEFMSQDEIDAILRTE